MAHFAGLCLANLIRHETDSVEILQQTNGCAEEIRVTKELFEEYLKRSIKAGICSLEGKYWINLQGVQKPEIINPEFEEKAYEWLKEEIYSRISQGKECVLLEKVVVKQEDRGMINLKQHYD